MAFNHVRIFCGFVELFYEFQSIFEHDLSAIFKEFLKIGFKFFTENSSFDGDKSPRKVRGLHERWHLENVNQSRDVGVCRWARD